MRHEFTHNEYYGQFVTELIIEIVGTFIGEVTIKNSNDPLF